MIKLLLNLWGFLHDSIEPEIITNILYLLCITPLYLHKQEQKKNNQKKQNKTQPISIVVWNEAFSKTISNKY